MINVIHVSFYDPVTDSPICTEDNSSTAHSKTEINRLKQNCFNFLPVTVALPLRSIHIDSVFGHVLYVSGFTLKRWKFIKFNTKHPWFILLGRHENCVQLISAVSQSGEDSLPGHCPIVLLADRHTDRTAVLIIETLSGFWSRCGLNGIMLQQHLHHAHVSPSVWTIFKAFMLHDSDLGLQLIIILLLINMCVYISVVLFLIGKSLSQVLSVQDDRNHYSTDPNIIETKNIQKRKTITFKWMWCQQKLLLLAANTYVLICHL